MDVQRLSPRPKSFSGDILLVGDYKVGHSDLFVFSTWFCFRGWGTWGVCLVVGALFPRVGRVTIIYRACPMPNVLVPVNRGVGGWGVQSGDCGEKT